MLDESTEDGAVALRREDVALQRLRLESASAYSMRQLELQAELMHDTQLHEGPNARWSGIIGLVAVIVMGVVIIVAMYLNKDALLDKVLTLLVGALGGGGVVLARRTHREEKNIATE